MGLLGDVALTTVVVAVAAAPLALSGWAFLDAARRPAWAWSLAGRDRAMWLTFIFLGVLVLVGGLAVSGWYLAKVRPIVAAAEDGRLPGTA
jgi:hypothetical protein